MSVPSDMPPLKNLPLPAAEIVPFRALLTERQLPLHLLVISVVFFLSNISMLNLFSLYADDWYFFGRVFREHLSAQVILQQIVWGADGRLVHQLIMSVMGIILYHGGSIAVLYIFILVLSLISLTSLYLMLRHNFPPLFCLLSCVLFAVSPLYSLQEFLNGQSAFATGFTLLFGATILLVRRQFVLAYFVGALSLLVYEFLFPIFVLLPLGIRPIRSQGTLKQFAVHVALCAALLCAFTVFKEIFGSRTVGEMLAGKGPLQSAWGIVLADLVYTGRGLWSIVNVPLWLHKMYAGAAIFGVFVAIAAYVFMGYALRSGSVILGWRWMDVLQAMAVFLLCMMAGYALVYLAVRGNFEVPVFALGRDSRFHSGASVGACVLTALVLAGLIDWSHGKWARKAATGVLAIYVGLVTAFAFSHQIEYEIAAGRQKIVIAQLMALHPKMDPEATFVIYRGIPGPGPDRLALGEEAPDYYFWFKYSFLWPGASWPPSGPAIRRVYVPDWAKTARLDDSGEYLLFPSVWPDWPDKVGHIWYYKVVDEERLVLQEGPVYVGGKDVIHHGPVSSGVDVGSLKRFPLVPLSR